MSVETKSALDAAIAAHVADECAGALVSGYVLQAAYFSTTTIDHGTTGYVREFAEDQAWHTGYGLANYLVDWYRNPEWFEDDDE